MDPQGSMNEKITDLAGLDNLDLSCANGCFSSPDLKWMAVTTGPPDHDGFDFAIGRFTNAESS
jgi:trehalose-6-phosphatase